MLKAVMRFFGLYAPSKSIRVAMYRKAGIRIGKNAEFGSNNWLDINFKNMINIGNDVILAGHDLILSHSFIMQGYEYEGFRPVVIEDGARIGAHVLILAGVTIGEGSVIGAGAVVVNDIPPYCLAVGVPAKPIRYFKCARVRNEGEKVPKKELMLYIRCKTCGVEYWSAIVSDKQVFKTLDLQGNCHPCPNGHKDRYDQKDYYFKE